jgi:hypothetical protein
VFFGSIRSKTGGPRSTFQIEIETTGGTSRDLIQSSAKFNATFMTRSGGL